MPYSHSNTKTMFGSAVQSAKAKSIPSLYLKVLLIAACLVCAKLKEDTLDSNIFYVQPSNSSQCDHSPCHTLMWYISHQDMFFISDATMVFLPGKHLLNDSREIAVDIANVNHFTMTGKSTVNNVTEIPTIMCIDTEGGFRFVRSGNITINYLSFIKCGVRVYTAPYTNIHPGYHYEQRHTSAAISFLSSVDVNLYKVLVSSSIGYGLYVDRCFRQFTIDSSTFAASRQHKRSNYTGNAHFRYSDHPGKDVTLLISHSMFVNTTSDPGSKDHPHYGIGLSITLTGDNNNVSIDNVTVEGNGLTHGYGGNMAIYMKDINGSSTRLVINNSIIGNGRAEKGGGLSVVYSTKHMYTPPVRPEQTIILIHNTLFKKNHATQEAGAMYIRLCKFNRVGLILHVIGCNFTENYAGGSGGAIVVFQHWNLNIKPYFVPPLSITFEKCHFSHCMANNDAVMHLYSTEVVTIRDSVFCQNDGTAISLTSSSLTFEGNNTFKENRGVYGGALKVCDGSLLLFVRDTYVQFTNNSAVHSGGAIYAEQQCLNAPPACFFQPNVKNITKVEELGKVMRLEFVNNSADIAGHAIYGGSVDDCITYKQYTVDNKTYFHSKQIFDTIFDFSSPKRSSLITSDPYGVCFCDSQLATVNCSKQTETIVTYAGKKFQLTASAVGQRNGTVPAKIVLQNMNTTERVTQIARHDNDSEQATFTISCQRMEQTIYTREEEVILKLLVQQSYPTAERANYYHPMQQANVSILLQACPWLFELTNETEARYGCNCNKLLANTGFQCNINNETIKRTNKHYWAGCHDSNYSQDASTAQCKLVALNTNCKEDYCSTLTDPMNFSSYGSQCVEGRDGVLCGSCVKGYSLSLGPLSKCVDECPVWMLILLVLVFALAGIMLVLFLAIFDLTVSRGTINGLLFYAALLHGNKTILFPIDSVKQNNNICRMFIAWLNLDLGIQVCFYQGMDEYQKIWFELGFIMYLMFLKLSIICLSRRFIFFTRLIGRNSVHVMSTIMLLVLTKTLRISLKILQFTRLYLSDSTIQLVWYFDGNIKYFQGKHIVIGIVGILLAIIVFTYTLSLLFIQCLHRLNSSNWCLLGWVQKLKPFFDSYTGPCHPNYRFWPGLLIFLRLALFIVFSILDPRTNLLFTLAFCTIMFILACVSPKGVYEKRYLNILECSFILNLGLLSGIVLCLREIRYPVSLTYTSVGIAMLTFAGILFYHGYKQITAKRITRRAVTWFKNSTMNIQRENVDSDCTSEPITYRTPLLSGSLQPVVSLEQPCEPSMTEVTVNSDSSY